MDPASWRKGHKSTTREEARRPGRRGPTWETPRSCKCIKHGRKAQRGGCSSRSQKGTDRTEQSRERAHQRKPTTINETTTNTKFKNKQPTITEQNTLSRKSKDDNRVWKRQKLSIYAWEDDTEQSTYTNAEKMGQ